MFFMTFGFAMMMNAQTNMGFIRGVVEKDNEPMSNAIVVLYNSNAEEIKKVRTEKLKNFQRKIHDYGHQMAAELSESNLKKQGLH
jgi:hypothetical protein